MAEFTGILYRKAGGTTELNRSVGGFCAIESATLEDRWQDGGTIDLSIVTSGTMVFYDGDYVVVKGRPYEIRETISEYTAIDDTRNRYAIKLHYPDIRFKRAIMYNTVEQEDGGVFSWMRPNNTIVTEGSFQTLVETCCYNANEVTNERVFKIGTISEDIETDFRVLSFSDTNCWATLKQICEEWNTFYTIRANTDVTPDSLYIIDFGVEPDPFPDTISIGKNKGISELKLNYSDSDVYTQFIVLGSTENLPSAYPNERLQLDTDIEATPPVYDYSMIVADDKYAQWGRKRMELVYEDIKPTRTASVTGLPESNIFAFYDTSLAEVIAEEPTWNPVGGTVHVVEGPLLGYTFEIVGWHAATYKITIKQISDSNGFTLPNEDSDVFRFTVGTKYNLADIPLPTSYVTDAKTRLKERAVTVGIPYWSQPRASFSLSVDPFFTRNEEVELSCGMLIPIVHPAMSINKSIRIKRISYNLLKDKYFDVESVEVSDIEQDNYMNSIHKDVQRTISTIKTAGYVTPSVTKKNNLTTLYNSIVSGYGFISYEDFIKWCGVNQGIMIQALEGEVGSEELVHIINADLLRVNDAFANRILANEVFIAGLQDTTEGLVNNFILHLTSSVATVACDSDGNVVGSLPSSQAIVYHGASADTGWAFGKEVNGCTATVNESSGAISIDTLTADDATVTITATKADKPTLTAIMRISKVYAGVDGSNGVGITGTTITYAVSSSGTTAPESGWQSTPPAATAGQFMWTKTVWAYSDSSTETGYSVGKIGDTGATGSDGIAGADGVDGIDGTDSTTYYLLPSVDIVIRSMSGTATPSTVSCEQWKVTGAASPVAGDKTLKYKRSIDESETAYTTAVTVGESLHIDFLLYSGETLLWSTRVPVLQDLAEWETTLNDFAKGIGYADGEGTSAYEKLVGAAGGETTIIVGGYLRTSLIDSDAVIANAALIGGVTISGTTLYTGTGTYGNSNTPFYLEGNETYKRFSLGNKFTFDGTDLVINGSGTFSGTISVGTSPNIITIGKDAYDTGKHGIKLNAYNYWYLEGANAKFMIGGESSYIEWNSTTLTQNGAAFNSGSIVGSSIDIPNATTPLFKVTSAGVITAKRGTIGGVSFTDTKLYLGTGTYGNSNTGFYVDTSAKFSLKEKLKFDGTNLTINGGGTFSGALSAASGTFAGSLSAASGTFAGSLSAASGTFAGTVEVGTLKIGDSVSGGNDGIYMDSYNYWLLGGDFIVGSSTKNLFFDQSANTLTFTGALSGATGTFNGVYAGTIEVGSTLKIGADAGGTGDFGIYIDSVNYWLESGFSVGVSGSRLYLDGSILKFTGSLSAATGTFAGSLSAASGTFGGLIDAGGVKIGLAAGGAGVDGIYIDANNYWYDTGSIKIGGATKYITYSSGNLSMVGGSFSASDGTTTVNVSSSAAGSAGISVVKGSAFAQIGLSGDWPSVFLRSGGAGQPYVLLTPGEVEVGDSVFAILKKGQLSLSGLVFNTTNLGTGNVVKTAGGGFLRFGTSKDNEDASHTHQYINGYKIVVGTGSSTDTIYFSTT